MAANKLSVVASSDAPSIEMGVPIPNGSLLRRGFVMAAAQMIADAQIGASVFIPTDKAKTGGQVTERFNRVGGKGWVTLRKVDGGWRVWKIAEPKLRA